MRSVAKLGPHFLTSDWLSKRALFIRARDLIASLQGLVHDDAVALRTLVGSIRAAGQKWRIPVRTRATVLRIVAASPEHFATPRFFLDDLTTAAFARALHTGSFQNWPLFLTCVGGAGQVIAVTPVANQHGGAAGFALLV